MVLGFSEPFWPKGMYDVVIPGGFVPEIWMLTFPEQDKNAPAKCYMTCFLAGEKADDASKMDPKVLLQKCVEEMDEVFGTPADPKPASRRLKAHFVADWAKEKYVQGAYTYPTHGAESGDREAVARPVAGKLFFAGEATHPGINPCVQGAMETAERAVAQIANSLTAIPSRM